MPDFIDVYPCFVGGTCANCLLSRFSILFYAPFEIFSSMLFSLGAQSRFSNYFFFHVFFEVCATYLTPSLKNSSIRFL
jgi:hypothetical protein